MKISSIKKLVVEDYKSEVRETIQRLATVLNPFLDQVVQAMSGNLTTRDNLKCKVYSIELPAGTSTYTVAWPLNEKPTSVHIGQLTKNDFSAPAAVFALSWRYDSAKIILTFIGLNASFAHKITIIGAV
jgi:hypothetical protein